MTLMRPGDALGLLDVVDGDDVDGDAHDARRLEAQPRGVADDDG